MDEMQKRVNLFTMSCMLLFQIINKVLNSSYFGSLFLDLIFFYSNAFVAKAIA